jgi:hypothetical protein
MLKIQSLKQNSLLLPLVENLPFSVAFELGMVLPYNPQTLPTPLELETQ